MKWPGKQKIGAGKSPDSDLGNRAVLKNLRKNGKTMKRVAGLDWYRVEQNRWSSLKGAQIG